MEIAEEQHCRLKEVRLNLTTPLTSEVEASEPENYGGARPKTIIKSQIDIWLPPVLCLRRLWLQTNNSSHSELKQGQPLEKTCCPIEG